MSSVKLPLVTEAVSIDEHCVGEHWLTQDIDHLAKLVAIIAMGQADQAAYILQELLPAQPSFTHRDLIHEVRKSLQSREKYPSKPSYEPNAHRDGVIFEAISWIVARL